VKDREPHEGRVRLAIDDLTLRPLERARFHELDLNGRKVFPEAAQDLRARLAGAVGDEPDAEDAVQPSRQGAELGERLVRTRDDLARVEEQQLSGRS